MEKTNLTGYKRSLYQGWVTEGIRSGMDVEEAIEKAKARLDAIPKIQVDDNPLEADYFNSQREEVNCEQF